MPKLRKVRMTNQRKGKKFAPRQKELTSRQYINRLKKEHRKLLKLSDKILDLTLRTEIREILVAAEANATHERFHGFEWETTYDMTIENHLNDASNEVRAWFQENSTKYRDRP